MTRWEYLIVALPVLGVAKMTQGGSAAVDVLNREGAEGWEAVGSVLLPAGTIAVVLKRPATTTDTPVAIRS